MITYPVVLFVHLVSLVLVMSVEAISFQDALGLRAATAPADALCALDRMKRIAPLFPIAVIGVLGSGVYMADTTWGWRTPWIVAGLAGLVLVVILGAGVESGRLRALLVELSAHGLTGRARHLQRDPVTWSTRMVIICVIIAEMLLMTTKPDGVAASVMLICAVVIGVLGAIPFWRSATTAPATRTNQ